SGNQVEARQKRSDLQEQLALIHPVKNRPVDRQHNDAGCKWFERCAEYLKHAVAQMDVKRVQDETSEPIGNDISRNRVHADHNQRESPLLVAFQFYNPAEACEEEEADAAAEQSPT